MSVFDNVGRKQQQNVFHVSSWWKPFHRRLGRGPALRPADLLTGLCCDCQAVAIRLNQTAIQAVTPITSFEKRPEGSPNPDRSGLMLQHCRSIDHWLVPLVRISLYTKSHRRCSDCQPKSRFQPIQTETGWIFCSLVLWGGWVNNFIVKINLNKEMYYYLNTFINVFVFQWSLNKCVCVCETRFPSSISQDLQRRNYFFFLASKTAVPGHRRNLIHSWVCKETVAPFKSIYRSNCWCLLQWYYVTRYMSPWATPTLRHHCFSNPTNGSEMWPNLNRATSHLLKIVWTDRPKNWNWEGFRLESDSPAFWTQPYSHGLEPLAQNALSHLFCFFCDS